VLDGVAEISRPERQARIPNDLPIYVFAGARDPVGQNAKSPGELVAAYRAAGLRNVKHRFYPGGRHEMMHETNRDEVVRDLVAWLAAEVKGTASVEPQPAHV
jgi:alpha-beta hydrolase superfamily lysophospholipase